MTTLRLLLFATLATTLAAAEAPRLHMAVLGSAPAGVNPDKAAPTMFQLALGAGALAPTDAGGNPEWPCFTGDAADWPDCAGIPSGGLVIGQPEFNVSLSSCTVSPSIPCLWLYSIVEDDDTNTTAPLEISIKVNQNSATLFDSGNINFGANAPSLYIFSNNVAFGPGNCPATETCVAPVAGQATITTTMTVGKSKLSSQAHINFQNEPVASDTALETNVNPSIFGQTVTLTATVTPSNPEPTGSVNFKMGSTVLGSGALSGGVATFDDSKLGAGTHSITALYSGDAVYSSSTSAPVSQVVNPAPTTTMVTSSKNPSTQGQSVTFTATVTSQYATVNGTVTFKHGSNKLGTSTLSSGQATLAVTTLPKGMNTITATYNPSANFTGSSGSMVQKVN